ncbi:hypothetical protein BCR36DRAFT_293298 [Piromyces finnis]|uniref:Uncharacterized protein n=1 Tax=Piromyces finnis TaxID=1754191 RepID=A0A1Y1V736_9FUNG|nr:hypothetical protein BCR36DRAFT_293298 [Piromyces finnis]|eukprot:ORX48687.1 hypothetical protein BCR36DRAFT_293298 [Piromyces finnis]
MKKARKKRKVGNESLDSSVNNSEANTPVLQGNNVLHDPSEMNPDQNNMYDQGQQQGMNPSYDGGNNYYHDQEGANHQHSIQNDQDQGYYDPQYHSQQPPPPHSQNMDMDANSNYYGQPPSANGMPSNGYDNNEPPSSNHDQGYPSYTDEYANILGDTNQLTMEQRQFIVDFLSGKKVSENETSKIIPLNVKTFEDPSANLSIREIIEFEMNFQNGTWRKLKKIKKTLINNAKE